jgi:uncharacterized damage-inducible protein DinB
MTPDEPGHHLLVHAAHLLERDLMPRIRRAVERLGPDDLWWRPNPASNAVGTLLLHMEGNLRQWVVSGLGGAPDVRDREAEFRERGGRSREELVSALGATVSRAADTLRGLDAEELTTPLEIQGLPGTRLTAVVHAVEHLSMHAGQIFWIVKARRGEPLDFYRVQGDRVETTW